MSSTKRDGSVYCARCSSLEVVAGQLEAGRFYPMRSLWRSLLAKPISLLQAHTHACLTCGLVWNEMNPDELIENARRYGLSPHRTAVMRAVSPDANRLPPKRTGR